MAKLTQIGSELSLADTRFTSKATIKLNSDIKVQIGYFEPQCVQ